MTNEFFYKESLITSKNKNFTASGYSTYKWTKSDNFGDMPYYIYNNKIALLSLKQDEPDIFILDHKALAVHYTAIFDNMWNKQAFDIPSGVL